ncbi:hypothetical protein ACH5RR_033770 [Cinchona calisaya]|uniref:Uncharacterized protein n=1 Tax=Cinchona calisaya TaxID=153742 RepID=A0ABD2YCT0_9GENT
MEDYLQYMKTLRSQMNEVEDQAAKISVEEQMHRTTIKNLEKDHDFVKNETKRVIEERDSMMQAKGLICSQILENQRIMASLESDSYTLSQTLDLMQHERITQTAKLVEKSSYYTKVAEDITNQLKDQQGWINDNKHSSFNTENGLVGNKITEEICEIEESKANIMKSLIMKFDAAKAELDQMMQMKCNVVLENIKIKQIMGLVKGKINGYKPELQEMDTKMLDEELHALLSDKTGEAEYLQSLQLQIMRLKEISHTVRCCCGEEFRVEFGPSAQA